MKILTIAAIVTLGVASASGQTRPAAPANPVRVNQATGHVSNYDEAKVGNYVLPEALKLENGQSVQSAADWFSKRRPELLHIYQTQVYGAVPDNAPQIQWTVMSGAEPALNGMATKRLVVGKIAGHESDTGIRMALYTPVGATMRVPLVLCINFPPASRRPGTTTPSTAVATPGTPAINPGDPATKFIAQGWGYGNIYYTDIQPDRVGTFNLGVIGAAQAPGTLPDAEHWGSISAWAWGLSRAIDYLQTDPMVDGKQVAIVGHSRLGKTVLWAGAQDPRIAIVFSSCAGEMGSSLSRRDYGETIDDMATNFPYQFAGNLQKYIGHWNDLPVDAHTLIALNAPHPIFITGGTQDQWADPHGEFLAEAEAAKVYTLVGKTNHLPSAMPNPDVAITDGDLGFNYHTGGHMIAPEDWDAFITFAGKYLKASVPVAHQ